MKTKENDIDRQTDRQISVILSFCGIVLYLGKLRPCGDAGAEKVLLRHRVFFIVWKKKIRMRGG